MLGIRTTRRFWEILAFINLAGALAGFFYYIPQLSQTQILLWPFVPDCPLYVLLFFLCSVLILKGKRIGWLEALTAVGTLKYGLWTAIVIPLFSGYFLSPSHYILYLPLWISHIGMLLESAFLFRKITKREFALISGWFVLNDFMDYFVGTRPLLPSDGMNFPLLAYCVLVSIAVPYCLLITKSNKIPKKY
jgi:uncharacterized membrane protein YpjA